MNLTTLKAKVPQFQHLYRTFRIIVAASKWWTASWVALLFIQGILPAATVILTKLFIDSLVTGIRLDFRWPQSRGMLLWLGLILLVALVTELLQQLGEWVQVAQAEHVEDHIKRLIHIQSSAVDLAFYESADFHDHLHRAREDAATRPLALLESTGRLGQSVITLLSMATVLSAYGLWLPLLLFASTLPSVVVMLRFDWRNYQWWKRTTATRRWTWYYEWMLTGNETAAEVRLFNLSNHFQSAYQHLRGELRAERLKLTRQKSVARMAAGILTLFVSGLALIWMVIKALRGIISLGDLALFYQAFTRGQALTRAILSDLEQIYSNSLFLGNLFEFLDLESAIVDPLHPVPTPVSIQRDIKFTDITFRYPGTERFALKQFNLHIPAGKTVAIVGANGAGKSTLLKLLCRFYDPEIGRIEIDDVDIRNFYVADLRRLVTVLFQSPVSYHATVAENISLGDLSAASDQDAIKSAALSAGADEVIARLPNGYGALLGRWFADGAQLSGGEWQRIALARAFFRRAQVIVLDEPTSAMDSWIEAEWFARLRALSKGRTSIVITHRFTIAMRADIIHVMHEGRIVESGSHSELLAHGGRYAQSWASQMEASSGKTELVGSSAG